MVCAWHPEWDALPLEERSRLKPGEKVEAEEIIAHCRDHPAGFKCPRNVVFAKISKTSTGKIQKFVLREQVLAL